MSGEMADDLFRRNHMSSLALLDVGTVFRKVGLSRYRRNEDMYGKTSWKTGSVSVNSHMNVNSLVPGGLE